MRRSSGGNDHPHQCPLPYSLPHINQVSGQDDWTAAKDRTTKKRIQNRVAQRTYRQRMKERMADLQAKLANCEREVRSSEGHVQGYAGDSPQSPAQRRNALRSSFTDASPPVDCPVAPEGIPSYSGSAASAEAVEQDVLGFSTSFLAEEHNRTSGTVNDDGHISSSLSVGHAQNDESLPPENGGTEDEHARIRETNSQPSSFALGDGNDLTSYLSAGCDSWESSNLTSPLQQEPWRDHAPSSGHQNGRPSFCVPSHMNTANPPSYDDTSHLTSRPGDITIDERIKCILSYLETMGFENIDELARAYYSHSFDEASFLHGEQRLSRNRRLPGVIASVFSAAAKWTTWERRGFQEEILKATEAVLISETLEAQSEIQKGVDRFVKAPETPVPGAASLISPLKKSITSKVSGPGKNITSLGERFTLFQISKAN